MYSQTTEHFNLPQWQNSDTPTWRNDVNGAFATIDTQLFLIKQIAENASATASSFEGRIADCETDISNINLKLGNVDISTIGGGTVTGAIKYVNESLITLQNIIASYSVYIEKIGDTDIGQGITLTGAIKTLQDIIGSVDITSVANTITQAIINLRNNIVTNATNIGINTSNISTILTTIGSDVITSIGTSITNAIVNLSNKIGSDNISGIGTSITNAIVNLSNRPSTGGIDYSTREQDTGIKWIDNKKIYQKTIVLSESKTLSNRETDHSFSIANNIDTIIEVKGKYAFTKGSDLDVWFTDGNVQSIQLSGTTGVTISSEYGFMTYFNTTNKQMFLRYRTSETGTISGTLKAVITVKYIKTS